MPLTPIQPPGRRTRKARAYENEIWRLHDQGYTLEVIREALAEAGVRVSKSTVQRELARRPSAQRSLRVARTDGEAVLPALAPVQARVDGAARSETQPQQIGHLSGKEVAQAFARDHVTNPLLRTRSNDENRRH